MVNSKVIVSHNGLKIFNAKKLWKRDRISMFRTIIGNMYSNINERHDVKIKIRTVLSKDKSSMCLFLYGNYAGHIQIVESGDYIIVEDYYTSIDYRHTKISLYLLNHLFSNYDVDKILIYHENNKSFYRYVDNVAIKGSNVYSFKKSFVDRVKKVFKYGA